MKDFPLARVYQLLEPGPVVLLTTAAKGRSNVMTMSWHMMVEFTPPLVACIVSPADHSFAALRARSEEHTSELQSLMRISYAVFCLTKKKNTRLTPPSLP